MEQTKTTVRLNTYIKQRISQPWSAPVRIPLKWRNARALIRLFAFSCPGAGNLMFFNQMMLHDNVFHEAEATLCRIVMGLFKLSFEQSLSYCEVEDCYIWARLCKETQHQFRLQCFHARPLQTSRPLWFPSWEVQTHHFVTGPCPATLKKFHNGVHVVHKTLQFPH